MEQHPKPTRPPTKSLHGMTDTEARAQLTPVQQALYNGYRLIGWAPGPALARTRQAIRQAQRAQELE